MRVFDLIIASIGILILSPLFFIAMILVKISSPGTIIYSQKRVGRKGSLFNLYKFRSMVANAEKMGSSVTAGNDVRITKVGKIMRKTKLDELPQLWNVLKGDMSFIGPRPDVPEIVDHYNEEMKRVLEARPGITSIASLHLRNEEDLLSIAREPDRAYEEIFVPAKVKLSMEHIDRKSLFFDLGVFIKTLWALTGGRIWPLKEHPIVKEIKDQVRKQNLSIKTII